MLLQSTGVAGSVALGCSLPACRYSLRRVAMKRWAYYRRPPRPSPSRPFSGAPAPCGAIVAQAFLVWQPGDLGSAERPLRAVNSRVRRPPFGGSASRTGLTCRAVGYRTPSAPPFRERRDPLSQVAETVAFQLWCARAATDGSDFPSCALAHSSLVRRSVCWFVRIPASSSRALFVMGGKEGA